MSWVWWNVIIISVGRLRQKDQILGRPGLQSKTLCFKITERVGESSSVIEFLSSMPEALGAIPSTKGGKKKKMNLYE